VRLDDVLRLLDGARSAAKFVIFDACRNELQLPTKDTTKGWFADVNAMRRLGILGGWGEGRSLRASWYHRRPPPTCRNFDRPLAPQSSGLRNGNYRHGRHTKEAMPSSNTCAR